MTCWVLSLWPGRWGSVMLFCGLAANQGFSLSSSCQRLLVWQSARPGHVQEWQGLLASHWAGQSLRHARGSLPRKHHRLERDDKGWAGLVSSFIRDSTNAARPCGYVHELILVVCHLQIPVSQNNRQWDALLCTRRMKAWRETLGTRHSWEFRLDYSSGKMYKSNMRVHQRPEALMTWGWGEQQAER